MSSIRPRHAAAPQETLKRGLPERRYLPELHGVRGLALLGVVLFHLFGAGRTSGGIDIFLAVSGFLFTGMLLREAATNSGRIDPLRYYGRLVRRILVPAAVVVAATLAIGLIVSPVTQHSQLWAEARASLLYFENFELINSQLAYGAAGPETSPFQHFWSLSVQGQFYIVWPVLAMVAVFIARRMRTSAARVMAVLIGIVFVTSFIYAIYVGSFNQEEAYLMTTTRAWQLAFGGLLALAGGLIRLPSPLRSPAGWVGLALIVSCGFVLEGAQLFPGPWALWPIAGLTLIFMAAGPTGGHDDPKWSATKFLSNKPLAWIGDHAYGLYLWHWPLLIFYMEIRDREAIGIRGALVILAATVVLAMLTYRYVESPLKGLPQRNSHRTKVLNRKTVTYAAATLVIAGLAMSSFTTNTADIDVAYGNLDQDSYPGAAQYFMETHPAYTEPFPSIDEADQYRPQYALNGCGQTLGNDPGTDEIIYCEDDQAPEQPTATIVLAGGSHAGHLEDAFKAVGTKYGWEVLVVVKSSCVFGLEEKDGQTMCGEWNENFVTWLDQHDVDLVVTPSTRLDREGAETEYVYDAAPSWWERISATNTDLMLVRGTPRAEQDIPECLAEGNSSQECGPPTNRFAGTDPLRSMDLPENVYPVDVNPYVCPQLSTDNANRCDAVVGNILVWRDKHHFTTPFSQSLALGFETEMREAVPHLVR